MSEHPIDEISIPTSGDADQIGPSDEVDADDEVTATEYDILSSPNDWNVVTIANYLASGSIEIPYFQRNYVWDMKRASRLIESLIVGLPVPQVFLYEQARNRYLVIDGQQRLLTILFFLSQRFPRQGRRGALRAIFEDGKKLDDTTLADDDLFQDFKLNLNSRESSQTNPFHGLKYSQLGDFKSTLELRTLRNVVVKQLSPSGDDAMYEIFNRLNSGGVNLAPQEIRASLYRSTLIQLVTELNRDEGWRALIGRPEPDARMQDVEVLLRAAALAVNKETYSSPMTSFVNRFCIDATKWDDPEAQAVVSRLRDAITSCTNVGRLSLSRQGRFSPLLFESVVACIWGKGEVSLDAKKLEELANDDRFVGSLQEGSTKTVNVEARLEAALDILG